MPFATYFVKEDSLDNLNTKNKENFIHFINGINQLNRKKRAILVNKKNDILEILKNKLDELDNPKIENINNSKFVEEQAKKMGISADYKKLNEIYFNSNNNLLNREFLLSCYDCFNSSYKYKSIEESINIDFEKDNKNRLDEKVLDEFTKDIIYASEFNNAIDFKDKFLNKVEVFIKASVESEKRTKGFKKKINSITLFHKELSKYLMPNFSKDGKLKSDQLKEFLKNSIEHNRKNITYDKHYLTNTKKIEGGTKFLLKWWHNLPEESKPKKFNIITDIPFQIKFSNYTIQNNYLKKIKEFLFKDFDNGVKKPEIIFLKKEDIKEKTGSGNNDYIEFWDWTHKKHFAFGSDLPLLISSEFGVEFIDPKFNDFNNEHEENLKIRKNNKFSLIDSNKDVDYEQIKKLYEKFPKKCGI